MLVETITLLVLLEILVLLLLQWDMLVEIMYGEEFTPSGFDCSGLIYYAYGQAGVSVPVLDMDRLVLALLYLTTT